MKSKPETFDESSMNNSFMKSDESLPEKKPVDKIPNDEPGDKSTFDTMFEPIVPPEKQTIVRRQMMTSESTK